MTLPPRTEDEKLSRVATLVREHAGKLAALLACSLPHVKADPVGIVLIDSGHTHTTVGVVSAEHLRQMPPVHPHLAGPIRDLLNRPPAPDLRAVIADFSFPVVAVITFPPPAPDPLPG